MFWCIMVLGFYFLLVLSWIVYLKHEILIQINLLKQICNFLLFQSKFILMIVIILIENVFDHARCKLFLFLRYLHANTASFFLIFFIWVWFCLSSYWTRTILCFFSYKAPRVLLWSIGVVIMVGLIPSAFMGLLPPNLICFKSL